MCCYSKAFYDVYSIANETTMMTTEVGMGEKINKKKECRYDDDAYCIYMQMNDGDVLHA